MQREGVAMLGLGRSHPESDPWHYDEPASLESTTTHVQRETGTILLPTRRRIPIAALARTCPNCVDALDVFVEAYGAEAGNLALRTVATGGVYVGGGIAPKILPALVGGAFLQAFRAKAPFTAMLAAMPVNVILNGDAGLIGAANFCFLS